MKTIVAAAALAGFLAPGALAQTADEEAARDEEVGVGGAVGLATGAAADTFFIRQPLEYHLLATELPGREIYLDVTDTGMQRRATPEPEVTPSADEAILEGQQPVGAITDLLIDRRGGTAGLVLELTPEMRGGGREIAVAMGLVRMLPDPEDPATTHILLAVDPVDIENAPTFERSEMPEVVEPETGEQAQPEEGAQQPAEQQPADGADQSPEVQPQGNGAAAQ